jgi:peptidylprolyl isomerase
MRKNQYWSKNKIMATTKKTAVKTTAKKTTKKKTTKTVKKAPATTVGLGNVVELHYKGSFPDGTLFDSSYDRGQSIEVTVGNGQLIAGFENALIGMAEGQTKTISLSPDEAYGPANPEAFNTVSRDQFPPDYAFAEGAPVQGATEDGKPIFATISSFTNEDVTLDLNHPLAGKDLNFEIELVTLAEGTTTVDAAESTTAG